jgi:DNA modification methylase
MTETKQFLPFYETSLGEMIQGDSSEVLKEQEDNSVDLIVTSPPYGLVHPKAYGNVPADDYCAWFKPFAEQFYRVLKDTGSLVIDIGGAWKKGQPTRSLYHYKLLIMLCEEAGFHLAQEVFWWNPAKLPTPTTWVAIRRVRLKDAVNTIWWLSKTPWPKASNRRVLQPYSPWMVRYLSKGSPSKARRIAPSGHLISARFTQNNGASIPPNLIALPNSRTNLSYMRYCREKGLPAHPARFPAELPEYFVRMLTDPGDMVVDPFGGSGTTAEVCERLKRRWKCVELSPDYLKGAAGRLKYATPEKTVPDPTKALPYYHIPKPGILWDDNHGDCLPIDGGKQIPKKLVGYRGSHLTRVRKKGRIRMERKQPGNKSPQAETKKLKEIPHG